MKWTQGIARLLPRAAGWLGRIHPPSPEDQGATIRFLDPDFASASECSDQVHAPLFDLDENGHMHLSAPMTIVMVDRDAGEFHVEPPLLSVVPKWNEWAPYWQYLVLPDPNMNMYTVDLRPEDVALLTEIRAMINRLVGE